MTSRMPGRPSIRFESTRLSFPTTPIAVLCSPGIVRALKPMLSMTLMTRSMSSGDAVCSITISIRMLLCRLSPPSSRVRTTRLRGGEDLGGLFDRRVRDQDRVDACGARSPIERAHALLKDEVVVDEERDRKVRRLLRPLEELEGAIGRDPGRERTLSRCLD